MILAIDVKDSGVLTLSCGTWNGLIYSRLNPAVSLRPRTRFPFAAGFLAGRVSGPPDVDILEIISCYVVAAGELPPFHKDLFDRLPIAQVRVENLTLLAADAAVARYEGAANRRFDEPTVRRRTKGRIVRR